MWTHLSGHAFEMRLIHILFPFVDYFLPVHSCRFFWFSAFPTFFSCFILFSCIFLFVVVCESFLHYFFIFIFFCSLQQNYKPLKQGIIESQFCAGESEGKKVSKNPHNLHFYLIIDLQRNTDILFIIFQDTCLVSKITIFHVLKVN